MLFYSDYCRVNFKELDNFLKNFISYSIDIIYSFLLFITFFFSLAFCTFFRIIHIFVFLLFLNNINTIYYLLYALMESLLS